MLQTAINMLWIYWRKTHTFLYDKCVAHCELKDLLIILPIKQMLQRALNFSQLSGLKTDVSECCAFYTFC